MKHKSLIKIFLLVLFCLIILSQNTYSASRTALDKFEITIGDSSGKTYSNKVTIKFRYKPTLVPDSNYGCLPSNGAIVDISNSGKDNSYHQMQSLWVCSGGYSVTTWDITAYDGIPGFGMKTIYFRLQDTWDGSYSPGMTNEAYTSRGIIYEQETAPAVPVNNSSSSQSSTNSNGSSSNSRSDTQTKENSNQRVAQEQQENINKQPTNNFAKQEKEDTDTNNSTKIAGVTFFNFYTLGIIIIISFILLLSVLHKLNIVKINFSKFNIFSRKKENNKS